MFLVSALFLPLVLLALPLAMERVERPLRGAPKAGAPGRRDPDPAPAPPARPPAGDYAPSVERYWRLRRLGQLRVHRSGSRS